MQLDMLFSDTGCYCTRERNSLFQAVQIGMLCSSPACRHTVLVHQNSFEYNHLRTCGPGHSNLTLGRVIFLRGQPAAASSLAKMRQLSMAVRIKSSSVTMLLSASQAVLAS